MAKKTTIPKIDLTGISTRDLITMDEERLMDFTRSQFRGLNLTKSQERQAYRKAFAQVTSRLVSTANKRIRNLGKSEIGRTAPAYINATKKAKFSVRGKNYNQLRNLFKVTKQFLKMKTSTLSGWEEVREDVEERIGEMSAWESKKFWKMYRMLEETNGGFVDKTHNTRLSSDQIQTLLFETTENAKRGWRTKRSDIIDSMQKKIDDIYKEEQRSSTNDYQFEDLEDEEDEE